jgi:hypothetical protein
MSHLKQAYKYDVRIRIQSDGASPKGVALLAKDTVKAWCMRKVA